MKKWQICPWIRTAITEKQILSPKTMKNPKNKKAIIFPLLLLTAIPSFAAKSQETTPLGLSDLTSLCVLMGLIIVQLIIIVVLSNSVQSIIKLRKFKEEAGKITKVVVITALGLLTFSPLDVFASGEEAGAVFTLSKQAFWILVAINLILFGIILYLFRLFQSVYNVLQGKLEEKEEDIPEGILTNAVPVEQEEEIMLDHEYDGIRELDNNLPPWWVGLFWATIIFSVVYMIHYHITDTGDLQIEEFNKEMAAAEELQEAFQKQAANQIDENNVELLTAEDALNKGKELYMSNCVACHGDKGQGGVGPNLTDEYWIHGGSISDIFKTIKYGVPAKGMIPWEQQMTMSEIHKVASFVNTMKGKDVPGGKEPEGELYKPEEEGDDNNSADSTNTSGKESEGKSKAPKKGETLNELEE